MNSVWNLEHICGLNNNSLVITNSTSTTRLWSILIIYNSTWSILIQWIRVIIVRWQSYLVKTKESVLPVYDKPHHTNKRKVQKWEEIKVLQNCALHTQTRLELFYRTGDGRVWCVYGRTWGHIYTAQKVKKQRKIKKILFFLSVSCFQIFENTLHGLIQNLICNLPYWTDWTQD